MSRKKYEYRIESFKDSDMGFYEVKYEMERILNKHGENGWELAHIENYGDSFILVLKREIS